MLGAVGQKLLPGAPLLPLRELSEQFGSDDWGWAAVAEAKRSTLDFVNAWSTVRRGRDGSDELTAHVAGTETYFALF